MGEPRDVAAFDIVPTSSTEVDLYFAIDRLLTSWHYTGTEWTHKGNFEVGVEGQFLVLDRGNSVLSVVDGTWCLRGSIEEPQPTVMTICQRVPGLAMVVVEDVTTNRRAFLHGNRLYDTKGTTLVSVSDDVDFVERCEMAIAQLRRQRLESARSGE